MTTVNQGLVFGRIEEGIASIESGRAIVVGVNGIDTSGKTMFAKSLSEFLTNKGRKTQLVHLDDFHNCKQVRSQEADEIGSYIRHAFNLRLLSDELLEPAKQGKVIDKTLTLLDLEADTFTNEQRYRVDGDTVLIIEGVLLYREPIDKYFDYRVFLDISFEELLRRAAQRDAGRFAESVLERYRRKYIPIQKRYLTECHVMDKVDLVVDNSDVLCPVIKEKRSQIK